MKSVKYCFVDIPEYCSKPVKYGRKYWKYCWLKSTFRALSGRKRAIFDVPGPVYVPLGPTRLLATPQAPPQRLQAASAQFLPLWHLVLPQLAVNLIQDTPNIPKYRRILPVYCRKPVKYWNNIARPEPSQILKKKIEYYGPSLVATQLGRSSSSSSSRRRRRRSRSGSSSKRIVAGSSVAPVNRGEPNTPNERGKSTVHVAR